LWRVAFQLYSPGVRKAGGGSGWETSSRNGVRWISLDPVEPARSGIIDRGMDVLIAGGMQRQEVGEEGVFGSR
jgi:hypothetical protein